MSASVTTKLTSNPIIQCISCLKKLVRSGEMVQNMFRTGFVVRAAHTGLTWVITITLFLHDTDQSKRSLLSKLTQIFFKCFLEVLLYQLTQPMRAKHCKTCGRCVRRFDHHCPWMENCVGEWNHRWFVVYLLVQLLALLWALHIALSGLSPSDTWQQWLWVNGFLLAALAVVGVFSVVVGLLLGCHLYLVSINSTTWEFMSHHRIQYLKNCREEDSPFDRGVFCNLWDFFCTCRTVMWEQVYQRNTADPV
uniref:Palmitoyltransferase n=1 Tax=Oryzias melastigma TaxID=30732 RepID=A0A3B3E0S5_ORYME